VCLGLPIRIEDVLVGTVPDLIMSFNAVRPPATGGALEHPEGYAVPSAADVSGLTPDLRQADT
jgi:hypothetical protein